MRKSTNKLAASVQKAAAQEKNLSVAKSADKSATTKNGTEKGAAGKNGHAKKPSIAVDDFFADDSEVVRALPGDEELPATAELVNEDVEDDRPGLQTNC